MAAWVLLPDGGSARIETRAACHRPAALPAVETLADGRRAVRLRVLLWNVEGLPWPVRSGRKAALAQIAAWIERRRERGEGPDIAILHEAFSPEASHIVQAGKFSAIVPGPALAQPRRLATAPASEWDERPWWQGDAIGKWLDSGLYVATDLPLLDARSEAFGARSCAGYDCLATKGGQIVRLALPGAPAPLTIFNTHRNAREAAGVDLGRAEAAHARQTAENDAFLGPIAERAPLIAAGDFNRYRAGDRTGAFARDAGFRLVVPAGDGAARPARMTDAAAWQAASDLLGFRSSEAVAIEPLAATSLFDGKKGSRLSDHDAQYVIFRLSWRSDATALPLPNPPCAN